MSKKGQIGFVGTGLLLAGAAALLFGLTKKKKPEEITPEPEPEKKEPAPSPVVIPKAAPKPAPSVDMKVYDKRKQEIYNAMSAKNPAITRSDIRVAFMFFDRSRNGYFQTGGFGTLPAGTRIYRSNIKGENTGTWTAELMVKNPAGMPKTIKRLVRIVGSDFNNIYVS